LKEDLGAESEGSTKTVTETITGILAEAPLPPRCFPGELFMIRYDSPPRDRETNSQRAIREGRNADHARCRREVDAATTAANAEGSPAIGGRDADQQRGCRVARNLDEEFIQVNGHEAQPTPSANLVMAMKELSRLR
jgi:hypothetical protein